MNHFGSTVDARRRKQAAGTFINAHANWAWWGTLTYRGDVPARCAQRDVRRYADAVARVCGAHVRVAYAVEQQERGVPHFHFLLAFGSGVNPLPPSVGEKLWRNGHAQVEEFDPTRGAAWYVAKGGDWDLINGCHRPPRCRRWRGCRAAPEDFGAAT
jgi:hypothetical protein